MEHDAMKTKKVWLNADPEMGMLVERYHPELREMYAKSSFYRRVAVPMALIKRFDVTARAFQKVQSELSALFEADKRASNAGKDK